MIEAQLDIQIPGHRVLRQLGRGGMASVYLALQESMEREVALKIMLPALAASDPSFSERFVREAKIIAKLSHPHVNAVYDVGVAGAYHYFTMEYLTGGDLKTRIRHGLAPSATFAIARQVASALAFAHSKGYVHRDVKPENVLFRDSGTAVLTDFGIAKTNDAAQTMTATGTVIGTPHYMSPEQAMGRTIDKRADIYSLGVMIFEMLTGKVPYTGDSAISIGIKHLKDPIPQLPAPLQAYQPLLDRFLAKNPAHRFQAGEEAIAAIDALAPDASGVGPVGVERTVVLGPAATTQRIEPPHPVGRSRLMLASALLVLIAVGTAYFALRHVEPASVASAPIPAPVDAAAPPPPDEAALLAPQIERLLGEAEDAARAGHYLEPAETAAVPKYRHVLELAPGNALATRALNRIAGEFIADAERAIEANSFDRAEVFLRRAEEIDPAHPMLFSRRLALKEYREKQAARAAEAARSKREPETSTQPPPGLPAPILVQPRTPTVASAEEIQARQQREREQKLQTLLSRFQEMVAPASLSAARVQRAQTLWGEATRIAPDDQRVRALPARLADAYLTLAADKVEATQYQVAETLIGRGLELAPGHQKLQALQEEVARRKKPKPRVFGSF